MKSKKFNRNEFKVFGFKRHIESFKFAFAGLKYALFYEQNFLIHLIATLTVVIMGFIFDIKKGEWLALIFAISSVLAAELFNSSIEAAVDLTTDKIHPLAKIAKDCGSAGVLIFALGAAIVGLIIFIPYIF